MSAWILVRILNALLSTKGWGSVALRWLATPLIYVGRFLFRFIFVRFYSLLLALRRISRRLFGGSRYRAVPLIANRFVLHGAVILLALAVSVSSVSAGEASTPESGGKTLLFAILSSGDPLGAETIQDETPPIYLPAGTNYLGTGVLRPSTDYDFDDEEFFPVTGPDGAILAPPVGSSAPSRAPREKTTEYVVEEGDTIGSIAAEHQVTAQTILWANNLGPRDYLQIGQKLKVPPVEGVLHVVKTGDTVEKIAKRYGAKAEDIVTANRLANAADLRVGEELAVPNGVPPAPPAAPARKVATPKPIAPIGSIFKPPAATSNRSTKLLWPTSGRVVTQYYGGWENVRGWRIHTGLDIDGHYDSPIYASEDGVVNFVGWSTGYGYRVDIDHGGGMLTRYAHASKLFVKNGQYVKRGEVIAMVGTTGFSTGTHLHFEVRIGGRPLNPISYLR